MNHFHVLSETKYFVLNIITIFFFAQKSHLSHLGLFLFILYFSLPRHSQILVQYPMRTRGPFMLTKGAGTRKWLLPSSAQAKNIWSYTFTPAYIFMARCLIKHRDNLTVLLSYLSFYYILKQYFLQHKFFHAPSGMIVNYDCSMGVIMLSLWFQCHITVLSFVL
jgi:hypothetical protein